MSPQKTTTLINQDASFSRNFYDSERINYLRLSRAKNLRNIDFFALINKFQNATNTIRNLDQYLQYKNLKKPIILASEIEILDEIKKCDKIGAKIIAFYDESYPKLLKEIADPPPIITIKGNIKLLQQNIIAIIGTRNASINGCRFTRKIASDLGRPFNKKDLNMISNEIVGALRAYLLNIDTKKYGSILSDVVSADGTINLDKWHSNIITMYFEYYYSIEDFDYIAFTTSSGKFMIAEVSKFKEFYDKGIIKADSVPSFTNKAGSQGGTYGISLR